MTVSLHIHIKKNDWFFCCGRLVHKSYVIFYSAGSGSKWMKLVVLCLSNSIEKKVLWEKGWTLYHFTSRNEARWLIFEIVGTPCKVRTYYTGYNDLCYSSQSAFGGRKIITLSLSFPSPPPTTSRYDWSNCHPSLASPVGVPWSKSEKYDCQPSFSCCRMFWYSSTCWGHYFYSRAPLFVSTISTADITSTLVIIPVFILSYLHE